MPTKRQSATFLVLAVALVAAGCGVTVTGDVSEPGGGGGGELAPGTWILAVHGDLAPIPITIE